MPQDNSVQQRSAVDAFWRNYLFMLNNISISKKSHIWCRGHVEMYISAHRTLRVTHHLPHYLDDYLNAKGRTPDIAR